MSKREISNRLGIVLSPNKPFLEWRESYAGKPKDINYNCDIFLVEVDEDFTIDDLPALMEDHYKIMFEDVLMDWMDDRSTWPELTYENFDAWFDVKYDFFVRDLSPGEIQHY